MRRRGVAAEDSVAECESYDRKRCQRGSKGISMTRAGKGREDKSRCSHTIKAEFRTRSRLPIRIHTYPTRISQSHGIVVELVGKTCLVAEATEALKMEASQGTSEGDRPPSGK
jgi:hypothetical protein